MCCSTPRRCGRSRTLRTDTVCAILAGGLARRMGGGDKGLRCVGGRPVLQRVAERLASQAASMVLNANGDAERFAAFGLPVVPDCLADHPGPLAGILAGMDWAAAHTQAAAWLVTVPGDAPFLPADLVARLQAARADGAMLACAMSRGQVHWVVALWPVSLRHELRQAITGDGLRAVAAFVGRYDTAYAEWPTDPIDPFWNVNTPGDLAEAERLAAAAYPSY